MVPAEVCVFLVLVARPLELQIFIQFSFRILIACHALVPIQQSVVLSELWESDRQKNALSDAMWAPSEDGIVFCTLEVWSPKTENDSELERGTWCHFVQPCKFVQSEYHKLDTVVTLSMICSGMTRRTRPREQVSFDLP